ncbi:MAG: hypothetical protein HYX89_04225 [Chloroflexi bacterium]|nr:hypothetical protein [Chloroflexota bacterium]
MFEIVRPGLRGEVTEVVTLQMAVDNVGRPMFASSELVKLIERASIAAVQPTLPPNFSTVGFAIDLRHFAPTRVGEQVTVKAEVAEVNENKITFRITAFNERGQIAAGTTRRAIVDRRSYGTRAKQL